MNKITHEYLIKKARPWLVKRNNSLVLAEVVCGYTSEIPDVLGFSGSHSTLIECKASRSDFLSDRKKLCRQEWYEGFGDFRYYLCPDGVIKDDELPEKWGLLYLAGNKIIVIKEPLLFDNRSKAEEVLILSSVVKRFLGNKKYFSTRKELK